MLLCIEMSVFINTTHQRGNNSFWESDRFFFSKFVYFCVNLDVKKAFLLIFINLSCLDYHYAYLQANTLMKAFVVTDRFLFQIWLFLCEFRCLTCLHFIFIALHVLICKNIPFNTH